MVVDKLADGKASAADQAVTYVQDGMILGLGTGSTAKIAIDLIGKRVAQGLKIIAVPTSEKSAAQARKLLIPLSTLDQHPDIDLTIDGADQVHVASRVLIKGLGGALLREKFVATASKKLIIIVDQSKLTEVLGHNCPVPVEIVTFAFETTLARLEKIGGRPKLRQNADGGLFLTDGGNYVADCFFDQIKEPSQLESRIKSLLGVVETGLFCDMEPKVIVGTAQGAREL